MNFHKYFENNIVKGAILLSSISCFVKLAGYVEKLLIAYYWGTGQEADIYNAVLAFILSIFVFFREIIEPGFMNTFFKVKHSENERAAWRMFFTLFGVIFLIGLIISLCLGLFPTPIIKIILPGFDGKQLELSANLLRAISISCLFLIISNLTYITLTAYKSFAIAALGDLIFKVTIIITLLLLARYVGLYAVAYGTVMGAALKLIVHFWGLRKKIIFQPVCSGVPYLKNIWVLTWPLLIGIIFSQLSNIIDNVFASYLPAGSISALSYSRKIVELPVVIFPYALSIVVFPYFSELYVKNDLIKLKKILLNTLTWIAIIFIPVAALTYFLSDNIISLIFQRGAFDVASTLLTARPLAIYSLGLPAFAIETVLVIFYFSLSDTKTPVFIGIFCVIINIICTWVLIGHVAYLGIAWSLVISKSLKVCILLFMLKYKFKEARQSIDR